ncbi:MAG: hypothetical protein ACRDCA_12510 [Serratia sp. (in: enterobacteria)]|uniref:hypothetical protein n=1 Tax=Serratia sp. (in: enterobacteria) TaxID=616 RepID=UPI003F3A27C0
MAALTIDGLKRALTYIQDNSNIAYYEVGPRKGIMVTDQFNENEAYHLRLVQSLEPRLTVRLAEQYTLLSLDGQELLHMLNDDRYLETLRLQLQRENGYSEPADVQVFKLLRKQLEGTNPTTSWPDVIKMLVERTVNEKLILPETNPPLVNSVVEPTEIEEKTPLQPQPEPEPERQTAKIIRSTKDKAKQNFAGV